MTVIKIALRFPVPIQSIKFPAIRRRTDQGQLEFDRGSVAGSPAVSGKPSGVLKSIVAILYIARFSAAHISGPTHSAISDSVGSACGIGGKKVTKSGLTNVVASHKKQNRFSRYPQSFPSIRSQDQHRMVERKETASDKVSRYNNAVDCAMCERERENDFGEPGATPSGPRGPL